MFTKTNKSAKTTKNALRNAAAKRSACSGDLFEVLEAREMFSTTPWSITTAHVANSTAYTMKVTGSTKADVIGLYQFNNEVTVYVDGIDKTYVGTFTGITVNGNGGNDDIVIAKTVTDKVTVNGGNGNILLSTGASNDTLVAGSGKATLIALGGKNNTLVAGSGYDNIWATAGNYYVKGKGTLDLHSIGSFINTKDMSLDGSTFAEPAVNTQTQDTGGWVNVNNYALPLFSSYGPQLDDIQQGEIGTCYFISSLGEIAAHSQQHIENLITPLGDGTYAEQFVDVNNGKTYFVRVDGYLPVSANALYQGELQTEYEHTGLQGCTWACLMEKGWAYFRSFEYGKSASYGFAEGGTGEEALYCLGGTNLLFTQKVSSVFSNGSAMLSWIDSQLQANKAVEIGIGKEVPGQLCGGHEYSVVQVEYYSDGTIAGIWLRNPWGVDTEQQTIASPGHNDGYNDGYVFISPTTLFNDTVDLASASV